MMNIGRCFFQRRTRTLSSNDDSACSQTTRVFSIANKFLKILPDFCPTRNINSLQFRGKKPRDESDKGPNKRI